MTEPLKEESAGGLVLEGPRVLLVKVKNLQGHVVWTFPKGHLEAGESAEQAALREVREETGWRCRLGKSLGAVHYNFQREGNTVQKTVHWFLMEPVEKKGEGDPAEIIESLWMDQAQAQQAVVYPSDRELMKRLLEDRL